MFFKNRTVTITVDKKLKNADDPEDIFADEHTFERKAEIALRSLEELGSKMFLGICVYILLDTFRQVKVAKAAIPPTE